MKRETDIESFMLLNEGNVSTMIEVAIDYLAAYHLYENRKYLMKDTSHKITTDKIHIRSVHITGNCKEIGPLKYDIDNHELEISPEVEVSVNEYGFIVLGIKYREDGVELREEMPMARLRHVFAEYGYYKR